MFGGGITSRRCNSHWMNADEDEMLRIKDHKHFHAKIEVS